MTGKILSGFAKQQLQLSQSVQGVIREGCVTWDVDGVPTRIRFRLVRRDHETISEIYDEERGWFDPRSEDPSSSSS